ncbi:MAG: polymerase delta subunit, partial [Deltaproteobacteria bacterium]|nr:polymerase delta subunit [Deltaproteobacteria bacterium]
MSVAAPDPESLLRRSLETGRIHSAYLLSGPPATTREAALRFARSLVCEASEARPCESCASCRRSTAREQIALDGTGKSGPLLRHIGDHADLLWVERGQGDTRVRIGQIRAVQQALRLRSNEGGRRAA